MYDLIVIGAGPAGITASVYAARKRMDFLVITRDIGGQAVWSAEVSNYPGYQFISGPDLVARFEEHLRAYDSVVKENERVVDLRRIGTKISVKTDKGVYDSRTCVVASGKRSKELGVPGEREFKNKGVAYCAICDGPLFAGKEVAVIGGGNSALDAALQLMKICRQTYVINAMPVFTGDAVMREKVEHNSAVTVMNNTQVTAIVGDVFVNALQIRKNGMEERLSVQGVFVEIGLMPNADFAPDLEKNEQGEIRVNCRVETNVPGIFAAGDVTDVPEKQIVIAAGEGAKASLGAFRYLASHKF
ncbi:MAG: FAD-dependent oxidoreductase [Candidatus Omnitrophota bacterium]|jgi:alkyl hydroperoxide reductase subunit F